MGWSFGLGEKFSIGSVSRAPWRLACRVALGYRPMQWVAVRSCRAWHCHCRTLPPDARPMPGRHCGLKDVDGVLSNGGPTAVSLLVFERNLKHKSSCPHFGCEEQRATTQAADENQELAGLGSGHLLAGIQETRDPDSWRGLPNRQSKRQARCADKPLALVFALEITIGRNLCLGV